MPHTVVNILVGKLLFGNACILHFHIVSDNMVMKRCDSHHSCNFTGYKDKDSLLWLLHRFVPYASLMRRTWPLVAVIRYFLEYFLTSYNIALKEICLDIDVNFTDELSHLLDMPRMWRKPSVMSYLSKRNSNENKALLSSGASIATFFFV